MRARHDRLSKYILEQALLPEGEVELEKPIATPDERRIDVYFTPNPDRRLEADIEPHKRLLYRMTRRTCLLEIFSGTPSIETLRTCVSKHLDLHQANRRRSKQAGGARPNLARLWVVSPGRPEGALRSFRLQTPAGWPAGFYRSPRALRLWLVALSELPATRETLLLRLLGSSRLRLAAAQEIRALPAEDPTRRPLLRALAHVKFVLDRDPSAGTDEERDVMSNLLAEFERHEAEVFRRGLTQGKASSILAVFTARGLPVSEVARSRILACTDGSILDLWLARALTVPAVENIFDAN